MQFPHSKGHNWPNKKICYFSKLQPKPPSMYIDFHLGQLIVYGHDKRTSEKVGSRTSKESLNSSKDGLRHSAIAKEKGRLLLLIYHMLLSVLLTFN